MTGEILINDAPEDRCFGCGHSNDQGLKLEFRKTGDASVETTYTVPEHFNGQTGIVHGGIQATLLDEVIGMSIHVLLGKERGRIVTAEMKLRYRRPTPTGVPLAVRGRVVRREDSNLFCEAEIVDTDGEVLTQGEARWRHLPEG